MPLTFPLSIAEFMDLLPIAEIRFDAPPQVEISQTAGGEIMSAELGPMLWRGQITLGRMSRTEAVHPDVLLDILGPAGRTFWAYDTRRPAPASDPTGALLGSATPTILSLVSAREMRLTGVPFGYQLRRGDYLSFDYSGGRRALHRVVPLTVVGNSLTNTPVFEVTPMIRPGATVGAAVSLIQASCKARLLPGQTDKGVTKSTVTEGMSFSFIQTLK